MTMSSNSSTPVDPEIAEVFSRFPTEILFPRRQWIQASYMG